MILDHIYTFIEEEFNISRKIRKQDMKSFLLWDGFTIWVKQFVLAYYLSVSYIVL